MTIQIFTNNAKTTLSTSITSSQTTVTVADGSKFPIPSAGQQFKVTFNSVTNTTLYEICNCTARSGNTLTVIRGQEGTSGHAFDAGDNVGHFDTAGVMTDLIQSEQLQSGTYSIGTAGGSANALTATITSNLTAIPNGMSLTIISAYANTGATTFNLTLGSTVTGVIPIVQGNTSPLAPGIIPSAGYPISLTYSATFNAWVLTDGLIDLSTYAPINSPTFTGVPKAPTYSPPSPTVPSPTNQIATTGYVYNSLQNYAPLFSPALTGTPTAPTPLAGDNSTKIATTAFVLTSASIPSGSVTNFFQASAPTGWTQDNTYNDYSIRIVSGTGGTTGGTTAFSTVFSNQTPTISTSGLSAAATTLSTAQMPSHSHLAYASNGLGQCGGPYTISNACITNTSTSTSSTGGGGSHTHAISGSILSSAITLNVLYQNHIMCIKN